MSILSAWIFLLSISLTIAVRLDGVCTNNTQCEGSGMICPAGKCQCDTPWYKPCKSLCELNRHFVYQGEDCVATENCIGNTICRDGKCECNQDYTDKNGVCFKSFNTACKNHTECWSNYCSDSRCICGPGYESQDNATTCRRKLVNIYNNWNETNAANAFCADRDSCIDIVAECHTDPAHPTSKFCKCPIGYKNVDNNRCEAIKGEHLSPLDLTPPSYGECGSCEDENAVCINAANQRTCWCRTGYFKQGNKCEQRTKTLVIFPNSNDRETHDFTNGCLNQFNETNRINNKICVCSPGYEFVDKQRPCRKIQSNWRANVYEYGLCTHINSRDQAKGKNGVCPEPLKCEARNDKHVCSCGKDKFQDMDDPTQCVYYIGKLANSTDDKCPTKNAYRNETTHICECIAGYKATNESRRCDVQLSSEPFQSSCNTDRTHDQICQDLFGIKALLCNTGVCRCIQNESFPNSDNSRCYAPLNQSLASSRADCPPHASLKGDHCECDASYRPSSNLRECVRVIAQLVEYEGPSRNTNGNLTTKDCQALFKGPVELYENDRCQCRSDSFINDDENGCWYLLNITLSKPEETLFCPPHSTTDAGQICQCEIGFTRDDKKCVQITKQVYIDNDPAALNITEITDDVCVKFFGAGAMKSTNGHYCICKSYAHPVKSNTYCHFLINVQNDDIKISKTCPANTDVSVSGSNSACVCKPGYYVSSNNQTCETANIALIDTDKMETTNCVRFSNNDCIAKYGEQSFCKDEKCYCNRQLSFINADGKCESLSNYIFPGEHELDLYSCNTEKDCGNKARVICDYLNKDSGYKICKCKDGSFLDPKSQTCVENRCTNCNEALHFECRDYQCKCKSGYYLNGSVCIEYPSKLELYQQCDPKIFREVIMNDSLVCDSTCDRAQCNVGYHPKDSLCARYQLANDKCVHQEHICQGIDRNSICARDENQCLCKASYYPSDNECARGIGYECKGDEDCGGGMKCKGNRCNCDEGQQIQETIDVLGRPIQTCVNVNGIGKIRFNPVLLLFFVLARVFF